MEFSPSLNGRNYPLQSIEELAFKRRAAKEISSIKSVLEKDCCGLHTDEYLISDPVSRYGMGHSQLCCTSLDQHVGISDVGTILDDLRWKQCPQYIPDQGYNAGCVFQAETDATLQISIRDTNGTKELYFDEQYIFKFLKPDPPENVSIQWGDGEVTAQCMPPQPLQNFELEFQYKSRFDKDWQVRHWQSRKNACCKIKDQGFDLEKCYTFRFRLKYIYGDYSSEWSAKTLWTNGSSVVSEPEFNAIILLTSVMAGLLIIFVLLLCVCRLDRIRKTLMPIIPDPKNIYSELFTDHNGDFQEWVSKTEKVLAETKLECIEEECVIEEKGEDLQENKAEA
ncbi:hypothetical protein JD844_032340 [Phrynosoma platyrhinos]|uniref:Cytokine receptor-like factor 2-like D2 domain-containing protein n=1 Tax=Phrynosoma platyrhinos TaxID=52577 RepID=A0ABQ7T4S7_PHRPL|nr:hypothetical protein JD844_032340 [Phrynosoma platyrhinos]